ncbi:Hypothetical protein WP1281 [Wolbachia endosymbiont of Culex quinquefasciatus Pel]|nr:Hypothetical protein WP1281 [Wolbachia endosymbiont of Culex quinquefasciatus Pel]
MSCNWYPGKKASSPFPVIPVLGSIVLYFCISASRAGMTLNDFSLNLSYASSSFVVMQVAPSMSPE